MTESTKPLMLGYIRSHVLMTKPELTAIEQRLVALAQREGYTLGMVYVERPDTVPAAFDALINAIKQQEGAAVVVPTQQDLSPLGASTTMKDQLGQVGARLFVAGPAP